MRLEFKPIDIDQFAGLSYQFVQETNQVSCLPDAELAEYPVYIDRMRAKQAEDPMSCAFAWLAGEIVGQVNFGTPIEPSIGYLGFLYVVPEWRGKGVAGEIERCACARLKAAGFKEARLRVTWANSTAEPFDSMKSRAGKTLVRVKTDRTCTTWLRAFSARAKKPLATSGTDAYCYQLTIS